MIFQTQNFFPVIYLRNSYDGVTVNKAIAWNDKEDFPVVFYYVALDFSRKKNIKSCMSEKEFCLLLLFFTERYIWVFFQYNFFLKVIDKR